MEHLKNPRLLRAIKKLSASPTQCAAEAQSFFRGRAPRAVVDLLIKKDSSVQYSMQITKRLAVRGLLALPPDLQAVVKKYGPRLAYLSFTLRLQYEFAMRLSAICSNDVRERSERYKCLCVVGIANLARLGRSRGRSTRYGSMDTWEAACALRRYELADSLIPSTRRDFLEIEQILDASYIDLAFEVMQGVQGVERNFADIAAVGRTFEWYLFSRDKIDAYIQFGIEAGGECTNCMQKEIAQTHDGAPSRRPQDDPCGMYSSPTECVLHAESRMGNRAYSNPRWETLDEEYEAKDGFCQVIKRPPDC